MKTDIGYYTVNGKIYTSKFDAVQAAKGTNAKIEWNFFDEVFSKVKWTEEPVLSLDELYRIRAQQIREKYDYVIVFCSGGADSNNVIRTFIKNNIKVDEVMALAPMSGLSNWQFNQSTLDEGNTISETKFALFPLLDEIRNTAPNIKITVNDYFDDIIKYNDEEWTYKACGNIVTVLTSHFTDVMKFPHIDTLIQQGKRIALVYGTDKPIIRINHLGDMVLAFSDSGVNYLNMPDQRISPSVDRVLFYWTPDLPELLVKQAHVVAKAITLPEFKHIKEYLKSRPATHLSSTFADVIKAQEAQGRDPNSKEKIFRNFTPNSLSNTYRVMEFEGRSQYEREIIPFIYPTTYSKTLFQCQKVDVDAGFFTRDQQWVHKLHGNTRVSEMIMSGIKALYSSIPEQYLNVNGTGFTYSFKAYKFGNIRDFEKILAN